ncbi:MAG: hypothetical protein ACOYLS_15370 [Polymorphobacter sp.]
MIFRLFVVTMALAPSPLFAQNFAPQPVPPIAAPSTDRAVLRTGTEVQLRLMEEITTKKKKMRVGQRVRLETAEAVIVQGVTIVPVGSTAVGEITDVENKGMWGKSGHFGARVLYMTVNGRQIRLSGAFDDKGVAGGVGAVAVSAIVFLPAGFFMTGTSAKLPAGTIVKGFVDEDVPLEMAAAGQAPLTVGSQTPAPVVVGGTSTNAPILASVPVAGAGPAKLKAKTPSGFCYDVPKGYVGSGTIEKPATTTMTPACWEVSTAT